MQHFSIPFINARNNKPCRSQLGARYYAKKRWRNLLSGENRKSFPYHKKRGVDRELNVSNTTYTCICLSVALVSQNFRGLNVFSSNDVMSSFLPSTARGNIVSRIST